MRARRNGQGAAKVAKVDLGRGRRCDANPHLRRLQKWTQGRRCEFGPQKRDGFRTCGSTDTGCEREAADATNGATDEGKNESIMRLSWALVHSKQPEDVQRAIAMLEVSLASSNSPLQKREKLYLLAVGYYRSGEYSRSKELTCHCLEIAPDWRQSLSLKKAIEDRITKALLLKKAIEDRITKGNDKRLHHTIMSLHKNLAK
ncbi:PREDICTED: mitochondrial fission 1 protein A-like [Nicotiana attenuata]|uniref:mitochondrial fission 1 protein A-like n=1 Tax=Nicotiana attenuata TaxID=49451 RepID=UPI000904650E|nr:PREDICTED: mitochondrial fission 1 protein A-like [Nicotiana attenuata]